MTELVIDPTQAAVPQVLRVLAIEDNPGDAMLVREMLVEADPAGFDLVNVERLSDGIDELLSHGADCVLLDLSLPDAEGLEGLAQLQGISVEVPIIVLSGRSDERVAMRAVQSGAQDYLIKGQVDPRLLARAIQYAVERKRVEGELAHQALHDPLTGLPNRALLLDRIVQAMTRLGRHDSSVAVLFCDLDRFKLVNDSLGHDKGDQLLVEVGRRLEGALRAGDTAARFGGDEFVILCEDVAGAHHAIWIAERVAAALAAPFRLGEDETFVRTSIGIAMASEPGPTPETLLRDADAAMYRAKERGGGVYEVYDERMRARAVKRLALESDLHRALRRGEFLVHYQPQFVLATGQVAGVEALLRWQHPDRGLLSAGEFFKAVEDTGLILQFGTLALRQACEQLARWADGERRGRPLRMSINLSARQCADPQLVALVRDVLAETGAPPASIRLEVTEMTVMADPDATVATLRQLRALGVSLAIDNFGTGWSSLLALRSFPVDEVKIDGSFVERMASDSQETAVVAAVVQLSQALGLETTAEGVESVAQADRLRELGCEKGQGYYFRRPAPADALTDLLSDPI